MAGRLDQIPMRWPRLCKIAHRNAIKKGRTLALLEVCQLWVPGRNGQAFDAVADFVGAWAIAELVAQINTRMSRHLGASRRALFEDLERSALKPLPAEPYVFAEWKECRVGLDYHVEIDKHYYSVPHQLLREKVWARITARTVDQSTGRPRGSTGTSRARRCVSHEGTAQRARVPPIDYGDGLRRA